MNNIQMRLESINDLRLYEIQECSYENGKKSYIIQRVKLGDSEGDIQNKIAKLISKIDNGQVWIKTGKKKFGTVQYQVKGVKSSEIGSVTIKKKVKDDNATVDVPVSNLSDKFVEMSDENVEILESVKKNLSQLVDSLGKQVIANQPHLESFSRRQPINVTNIEKGSAAIHQISKKITPKHAKAATKQRVQQSKQSKRAHERKMEKMDKEKEERAVERHRKDIKQDQANFDRLKQKVRAKL